MKYKLGSLFDGSGGFPLAGSLCDIEPVWAAEVEPYPVAVTRSRFPNMKHYGDVSKINGAEVEPVDVITFGAPCQDLSVAGLRKGLRHTDLGDEETTRSGLFMEAIRIAKEMREATNGRYPNVLVYENVPGALSSSGGEDWRTVLQSLIKIVEPGAVMPEVPKGGWAYADCYCGDGWSLAYRILDSQYIRTAQRRRRLYLVLDLRGTSAGKILFEREGLRGYFAQGGTPWQAAAGDASGGSGADDREGAVPYTLKIRSGCDGGGKGALIQTDLSATLATNNDQYLFQPVGCDLYNLAVSGDVAVSLTANTGTSCTHSGPTVAVPNLLLDDQGGSQISVRTDDKSPTLRAEAHGNVPCVVESAGFKGGQSTGGIGWQDECAATLSAECSGTEPTVCVKEQHLFENHSQDARYRGPLDVCPMLPAQLGTGGNNQPFVVEAAGFKELNSAKARSDGFGYEKAPCLAANKYDACAVYCIDGDKIGKAERAGGSGLGIRTGDKMYTLTAKDAGSRAVAYTMQGFGDYKDCDVASGLKARDWKDATDLVCGVDCRNISESPELYPTLQAKPNGGQSLNFSHAVRVRYIVRRLTPTECARLQGFPDFWGHPGKKEGLTDEEYRFWLDVRNTHAEINGKPVKEYTREQILTWYNKLHTDSAEYKMWGNGIALPCALYVMQGIEDALKEEELWTSVT